MKEKYYIAYQTAEEQSYGIVHLTEEEHKAVQKFLQQVYNFSSGYCGSCGVEEKAYTNEEEAQAALYEQY